MNSFKKLLIALSILNIYNTNAQENSEKDYTTYLKKFTHSFSDKTQLSVLIIDGDTSEYVGVIKKEETVSKIDNKDRVFEIGSITKVFTTILLSNAIQQGKAKLDETIQSNFNFPIKRGESITLQHLSNHSSGFPTLPKNMYHQMELSPDNPYKNYSENDLETYLKTDINYAFKTGTQSVYSNLGMGLLGYILTKKENKTYEELLNKFIFKPLNMKNSSVCVNENKLVKGLNEDGSFASNWDFTDALVGAGGIKSNAVDMEKFIRKHFENDSIYSLPLHETYSTNKRSKIGLGWQIIDNGKQKFYWHNGGTGGYRSCLVFNKATKKAVLVLSNISAFHSKSSSLDTLCFSIFKKLLQ